MPELERTKLKRSLMVGGAIFTLIIFLWPTTMVLNQIPTGPITEQLNYILGNTGSYKLNFILASFIAPSIIFLLILFSIFVKTRIKTPVLNLLGVFFLVPYLIFVSISYTSQFTIFISLLRESMDTAKMWYFGEFNSLAYYFNQLGYFFFAIAGICIGYRFCFDKGIMKIFGLLIEICSLLSVIAFIGLILDNKFLNNATLISGLITLPLGIISIAIGKKI